MKGLPDDLQRKVSGPVWEKSRKKFEALVALLRGPSARSALRVSTVYVVFSVSGDPDAEPYAVAWIKNSRKWLLGLSLPSHVDSGGFIEPPKGKGYRGLTRYLTINPEEDFPDELPHWISLAFAHAASSTK